MAVSPRRGDRWPSVVWPGIEEAVAPRSQGEELTYRGNPRRTRRCCEPMIMIRHALTCVAMERSLQDVLMGVGISMVGVLMERNREHRDPGRGPQE
jgi:hypothetical protein